MANLDHCAKSIRDFTMWKAVNLTNKVVGELKALLKSAAIHE